MHQVFGAFMVLKGDQAEERLATMRGITMRTIGEDEAVLDSIRYRPGTLTAADRTLAKYLQIVREFPRAHPSGPFIR